VAAEPLGVSVERLCRSARAELVLCAPFAKLGVVTRLLATVHDPSVRPLLITRWRPEEVAAGVSDTAVLPAVEAAGGRVVLHDRLHAKYYRSEFEALLGSANLTATALGWSWPSNLELLQPVLPAAVLALERRLVDEGAVATAELAAAVELQAALLDVPRAPPEVLVEPQDPSSWVPTLRYPQDLFLAYTGKEAELSSASVRAANRDLLALDLPLGLAEAAFLIEVDARLWQTDLVQHLVPLLRTPHRFGAVSHEIASELGLRRDDADAVWQSLMRWLLTFSPHRVERRVSRVSEVLVLRNTAGL